MLLASAANVAANAPQLAALHIWAPAHAVEALELLSGPAAHHPEARAFAMRCLLNTPPKQAVFFLPQLVQSLRYDSDKALQGYFLEAASRSDLFTHQLIWALQSEEEPPPEAFNPEVKRSGWHPPKETGLWQVSKTLRAQLLDSLTPQVGGGWLWCVNWQRVGCCGRSGRAAGRPHAAAEWRMMQRGCPLRAAGC
jgi:hypothetical protein